MPEQQLEFVKVVDNPQEKLLIEECKDEVPSDELVAIWLKRLSSSIRLRAQKIGEVIAELTASKLSAIQTIEKIEKVNT
jgi:hypothetical protein